MNKCLYAGSFDPFHNGHQHIVERASRIFDQVVVLQAVNPGKNYALKPEVSRELILKSVRKLGNVKVDILPHYFLAVDYAKKHGIKTIVKGIRNTKDTEYERMLHEISVSQQQGVDTVVMFSEPMDHKISSSTVKELMKFNADVREYIPLWTKQQLEVSSGQYIYGITGEMGSGKSWFTSKLVEKTACTGPALRMHHLDLDELARQLIYSVEPCLDAETVEMQRKLEDLLGMKLKDSRGLYRMKNIGAQFFNSSPEIRKQIAAVCNPLIVKGIRHRMAGRTGFFILNGAMLIDYDLTYLCNNNITVVTAPRKAINARLAKRYGGILTLDAIKTRASAQLSSDEKVGEILRIINRDGHGSLEVYENLENKSLDPIKYMRDIVHPAVQYL